MGIYVVALWPECRALIWAISMTRRFDSHPAAQPERAMLCNDRPSE